VLQKAGAFCVSQQNQDGTMTIHEDDLSDLKRAKQLLENPGVAAKITNLIGTPIEKGFELLPDNWNKNIGEVTKVALTKASDAATFTMKNTPGKESSNITHKFLVAASGGIGWATRTCDRTTNLYYDHAAFNCRHCKK
jgi:hypothetical protein